MSNWRTSGAYELAVPLYQNSKPAKAKSHKPAAVSDDKRAEIKEWSKTCRQREKINRTTKCECSLPHDCAGHWEHGHHVRGQAQGGDNTIGNCRLVCHVGHRVIHASPDAAHDAMLIYSAKREAELFVKGKAKK